MRSAESGIYIILNTKNGKIYIGSSVNIKKRWAAHRRDLNKHCHDNPHLQAAWNKYGAKNFEFKILERCAIDQLEIREDYFLSSYIPKGIYYNTSHYSNAPMRGRKASEDHRRKISEANKGRVLSEETRHKISKANKTRIYTEKVRFNMSEGHKGRSQLPSHVENKADACRLNWLITSPDGEEYHVRGLAEFCKQHNLTRSALNDVANGKRTHHKGWTCRKVEE